VRRGEATRSVLVKVPDDVLSSFHAVNAKIFIITKNSHFGLLEQIFAHYNCCIDGDTSPKYFGYHLVKPKIIQLEKQQLERLKPICEQTTFVRSTLKCANQTLHDVSNNKFNLKRQ
jgi:hypothetical protein